MKEMRKKLMRLAILFLLVLVTGKVYGQQMVVIMSSNYTCDDPRGFDETAKWRLKKGDVLNVYKSKDGYEYYGGYTAASVVLPSRVCRLPGSVKGERYIVINATNLRLREKPSLNSGIYCYDEDYGGSIAQNCFLVNPKSEKGTYGNSYSWKEYYLPKGTRLPYLGKQNGFYKTTFDGTVFYVSSKFCLLK